MDQKKAFKGNHNASHKDISMLERVLPNSGIPCAAVGVPGVQFTVINIFLNTILSSDGYKDN